MAKRRKQPPHLKELKAAITNKARELFPGDPKIQSLIHLWITIEIKAYVGVRLFVEIPAGFTDLLTDLIATYRDTWELASDLKPWNIGA